MQNGTEKSTFKITMFDISKEEAKKVSDSLEKTRRVAGAEKAERLA